MLAVLLAAASTTSTTVAPEVQSKNPILPAGNEIVWGLVSFVLLFLLMWKFAFPAVKKGMEDRTERIRNDLATAEQSKTEAQTVLSEYQRQLADAKNEANRIIEETRQAAESLRTDLMARAESDAAEVRQRAAADIQAAKDRAMEELRTELTNLSMELTERLVRRNIDRAANTALVDDYIASIAK